ncbi:MAG: hypothetical protein IJ282_01190 [Lachnospiraceae bacterium]|nr:hypothetical protein [Lachnospiraceae bacterium]
MTEMKKKKTSVFWVCYVLFVLALVSFWLYIFSYVNKCLITYEGAQPEHVVEKIVSDLEAGKAEEIFTFPAVESRFEDPDVAKDLFLDSIKGKEFTFEKDAASYNALAPVYHLYAGDKKVAAVTLTEKSSYPLMFILAVQDWEITSVEPLLETPSQSVTIKVPDTYIVSVNGVPVSDNEKTGNEWSIDYLQYAAEYVTIPKITEYNITGLFHAPKVEITDPFGNEVVYTQTENVIEATEFPLSEMDKELSKYVLQNAITYSNFFSKDLAGCRNSVKPIAYMFPENSYYLELADNYRMHDMWTYSSHQTPEFAKEKVSDYIRYSDDLFSCNVYFEKNMILTRTKELRTDITDTTFYYAKIGDKWLIVDMQTNLEE